MGLILDALVGVATTRFWDHGREPDSHAKGEPWVPYTIYSAIWASVVELSLAQKLSIVGELYEENYSLWRDIAVFTSDMNPQQVSTRQVIDRLIADALQQRLHPDEKIQEEEDLRVELAEQRNQK